ncbi:UNVERIFIED_ORG: hypothetical protein M2348_003538 [Sphingomonas sp. R1F5B]
MIDKITIFVPHILMALMIWKLVHRADLDDDPALPNRRQPLMGRRPSPRLDSDGAQANANNPDRTGRDA